MKFDKPSSEQANLPSSTTDTFAKFSISVIKSPCSGDSHLSDIWHNLENEVGNQEKFDWNQTDFIISVKLF